MDKKIISNQKGMSLIEVMIAMTVFAVFVSVFVMTNGSNLTDSRNFKDELKLRDLASTAINEILVNPPTLNEGLTLSPETKPVEDNPGYTYTVEWKKFELPDYTKMMGENNEDPQAVFQKKVFEQVKNNMELMVWQLAVEVRSLDSNMSYRLATWIYNKDAKVKLSGF
ncbi:MAG: prepilin-type N-terminal cleavage/methylation domain-containing protein [Bacteriovoracaceae bacterium]